MALAGLRTKHSHKHQSQLMKDHILRAVIVHPEHIEPHGVDEESDLDLARSRRLH
jgi:hypothetical protein